MSLHVPPEDGWQAQKPGAGDGLHPSLASREATHPPRLLVRGLSHPCCPHPDPPLGASLPLLPSLHSWAGPFPCPFSLLTRQHHERELAFPLVAHQASTPEWAAVSVRAGYPVTLRATDQPQAPGTRQSTGGATEHTWHMLNSGLGVLAHNGFYTPRRLWKDMHNQESEV